MRASAKTSQSGACTSARPSVGPKTCTSPIVRWSGAERVDGGGERVVGAGQLGERAERRVRERAPVLDLGLGDRRGLAAHQRLHDDVIGNAGLHEQQGLVARPGREQLRAARQQPVGLGGRAIAGREQLLVEIEIRHERRPAPAHRGAVQHRLGADEDVGLGHLGGRGVDVDDARRDQRLELLADARDARPQHPQLRRAAFGAHERSLAGLVPAQQVPTRRTRGAGSGPAG